MRPHQAVAETYEFLTEQLATYQPPLVGLTATPGRTSEVGDSDYKLAEMFGNSKVTIDPRGHGDPVTYLIRRGFIADPRFGSIPLDSSIDVDPPEEGKDYTPSDLSRIGEDQTWRRAIVDITLDALRTRPESVGVRPFGKQRNRVRFRCAKGRGRCNSDSGWHPGA